MQKVKPQLTKARQHTIRLLAREFPVRKEYLMKSHSRAARFWARGLRWKLTAWLCKRIILNWYTSDLAINHERRMRRAYLREGWKAVYLYMAKELGTAKADRIAHEMDWH